MKFRNIIFFVVLLSVGLCLVDAQSLRIYRVDASAYPSVDVYFHAFAKGGAALSGSQYSDGDLWAVENGKERSGVVTCSDSGVTKFSCVVTLDISGSMAEKVEPGLKKIDMAKNIVKEFFALLPKGRFESALMSFHTWAYLIQDFSDDKALLLQAIGSDLVQAMAQNTDINSALLYDIRPEPHPGALLVAERACYVPFVLLITDGGHSNGTRPDVLTDKIRQKADSLGARIFIINLSPKEKLTGGQAQELESIADKVFWNVNTTVAATTAFKEILAIAGYSAPPCVFSFETDCSGGGELVLTIDNKLVKASETLEYTIPAGMKPAIGYSGDVTVPFLNIPAGNLVKKDVKLYAKNNKVTFTDDPQITLDGLDIAGTQDWDGVAIDKDDSLTVTLEYEGVGGDSVCNRGTIDFESNACSGTSVQVCSGWFFARPVSFGNCAVNSEHTVNYSSSICNNSCFPVTVESIAFTGGDSAAFSIGDAGLPQELPSGACLHIKYRFLPMEERDYSTKLSVTAGGRVYTSPVTGTGAGVKAVEDHYRTASQATIMLHPNPCSYTMFVNIDLNGTADMRLSIVNIEGRTYYRENQSNISSYNKLLDLSFLPVGYYIFQAQVNGKIFERTFLKR